MGNNGYFLHTPILQACRPPKSKPPGSKPRGFRSPNLQDLSVQSCPRDVAAPPWAATGRQCRVGFIQGFDAKQIGPTQITNRTEPKQSKYVRKHRTLQSSFCNVYGPLTEACIFRNLTFQSPFWMSMLPCRGNLFSEMQLFKTFWGCLCSSAGARIFRTKSLRSHS